MGISGDAISKSLISSIKPSRGERSSSSILMACALRVDNHYE